MLSDDDKVPANSKAMKKIRNDLGWGLTRVENELKALKERGEVSAAPRKSTIDRMEKGDGTEFAIEYYWALARAYNIDPNLIIASEAPQKFLQVTAQRVKVGRELREAIQNADAIVIELEDEPGDITSQQAVLTLADYADTKLQTKTQKDKFRIDFSFRKIIEDLSGNGFNIFMAKAKQIAPFHIAPNEGRHPDCTFRLVSSPEDNYGLPVVESDFDGLGICDVLVLRICLATDDFIKFQHDMDPVGFANDSPFTSDLWESLARMSVGADLLTTVDVRELPLEEFISPRARQLEIERRKREAKNKATYDTPDMYF